MKRRPPTRATSPKKRATGIRLARSFFERAPEPREDDSDGGPKGSPVVVGLGNPGRSYERTRHNVGYLAADELAKRYAGVWRKKKKAEAAPISFGLKNVTLLKPTTFMNNSGAALSEYHAEALVVIHDDLDLPVGDVRVKVGGGAGGHNGLRSIIQSLGNDFTRVRIGIGRPPIGVTVTDYVLGRMDSTVKDAIPIAADAVEFVLENGVERAMNHFNTRGDG